MCIRSNQKFWKFVMLLPGRMNVGNCALLGSLHTGECHAQDNARLKKAFDMHVQS